MCCVSLIKSVLYTDGTKGNVVEEREFYYRTKEGYPIIKGTLNNGKYSLGGQSCLLPTGEIIKNQINPKL